MLYMRWLDGNGKVVRVARMNGGSCQAFYPGEKDIIYEEFIREIDDPSQRNPLDKKGLKDNLLLRLLSGEDREKILKDYEPAMEHRQQYLMAPRGSEFVGMNTPSFILPEDLTER